MTYRNATFREVVVFIVDERFRTRLVRTRIIFENKYKNFKEFKDEL